MTKLRNQRLCLHPNYRCRMSPLTHDDRTFKDEYQKEVYQQVAAYCESITRPATEIKVVDMGCGSGYKLMTQLHIYNTLGWEIEPAFSYLVQRYPNRCWGRVDDLSGLSFEGDVLICADVIEHLYDPELLLRRMSIAKVERIYLSTPCLDMHAGRGQSPRFGPPSNMTHYNEWTTAEFKRLVGQYLKIREHLICSIEQGTQLIIAEPSRS